MLAFDPAQRISVDQALDHPYLAALHDAADEPECVVPFDFLHEGELSSEWLRVGNIWSGGLCCVLLVRRS